MNILYPVTVSIAMTVWTSWPLVWVYIALRTSQPPLTSVFSFCEKERGLLWNDCPSIKGGWALHIYPTAGTHPFCRVLNRLQSYMPFCLASFINLYCPPCFLSVSLFFSHIHQRLHLISFLQLYPCVTRTCYESNNVVYVFDTGNFCHFHLWSRVCLKNLGCWVLLSLQRMEGETQICQEAFMHAG